MKYRIRIDCTPKVHELLAANDFDMISLYENEKEELVQIKMGFDLNGHNVNAVIIFSVRKWERPYFEDIEVQQKVVFVRMSSSYYDEVVCSRENLNLNTDLLI